MVQLRGIAASDGVAIAPAYLLVEPDLSFDEQAFSSVEEEVKQLEAALQTTQQQIEAIRAIAAESLGEEEAQVFDAHLLVLQDPEFTDQIKDMIESDSVNAKQATKSVATLFITMFESMVDNPYMQERAADIRDVSDRLLAALLGVTLPSPATIDEEVIVVADDLTPSDTAQLNKQYVQAFVTNIGGRTSHSAIMARSLEIPAIVGTTTVTQDVKDGDLMIVDALEGEVIVNPSEEQLEIYRQKAAEFEELKAEWARLVEAPSVSKDGVEVEIAANIGTPADAKGAIDNGADAIGLYRTEFLYMESSDFPSEEEQFEAYKEVLEAMDNKGVVVRTMDIGGDKELPYWSLPEEMNPFLGYRAIRISLDQTEVFKTQLRALLRASVYGDLRIMFPMIATIQELREAKAILKEVEEELISEGHKVADNYQVGIMVEIPAVAVLADQFAKEVDFFSLGTNDLIQYSMAADRMNEEVSYLYQPYNPSVLRLIKNVIDAAHAEGKWAGMCGEVAGDQKAVPLLLGMGLDEFSMSASSILRTRSLISKLDTKDMQELAHKAVTECSTSEEVEALVDAAVAKAEDEAK